MKLTDDLPNQHSPSRWPTVIFVSGMLLIFIVGPCCMLLWINGREQARFEKERQFRRLATLQEVKNGETSPLVSDGTTLDMLASDKVCSERITSLQFSTIDFGEAKVADIRSFPNLKSAGFYDGYKVELFFKQSKSLPEMRSLWFESTEVTLDLVKTFRHFPNLKHLKFEMDYPEELLNAMRAELPGVDVRGYEEPKAVASPK